MPSLHEIVEDEKKMAEIQDLSIDDLLPRNRVRQSDVSFEGLSIMITGAGGSIGSELVFQLSRIVKKKVICLDVSELSLYKLKNNIRRGKPNFKIETPNRGDVKIIAGTNPIKVLTKAVKINDVIISFNFKGAINKFVKFLLQISSKKSILKLILDLNRIS